MTEWCERRNRTSLVSGDFAAFDLRLGSEQPLRGKGLRERVETRRLETGWIEGQDGQNEHGFIWIRVEKRREKAKRV